MPPSSLNDVLFVDQLRIFFLCVAVGGFGFLLRDCASLCLLPMRGSKGESRAYCVYEVAFFTCFSVIFLSISVILGFPPFRGYMFIGILVGFWLYYKFFRIIVAFFKKMCYNIFGKRIANVKTLKNER